jgi:hypothetical protein
VRYETGSGRHPEGLTTRQEGKAMGKSTVGQQNSEAIETHCEDHGTGYRVITCGRRRFGQSSQPTAAWHR